MLSQEVRFDAVKWDDVPDKPGTYVIYASEEVLYVGMAGKNGKGSLRNRLKGQAGGQIVNMFPQYLFLKRVQFLYLPEKPITNPRDATVACREYILKYCSFRYAVTPTDVEARALENQLKNQLNPTFNPG